MTTDNIGLTLTGASETSMTFLEWRTLMNGTGNDSNMKLIDGAIGLLNAAIGQKADGFTFNSNTGVLQLTSNGSPISGASVTINLNNYYTKTEVEDLLSELEENLADTQEIQDIKAAAISELDWDEDSRTLTMTNIAGDVTGTINITGGGGGGGSSAGVSLSSVVKPSSVRNGDDAIFSFVATSTDDTNITVTWYVDGVVKATNSDRASGSTFSFNAKNYLRASDTSVVKASVSTESGAILNRQWSITSSAYSLAWGSTIQPITLYTSNSNVYVVVNVSAQAKTENIVTLTNESNNNSESISKTVSGSKSVTFEIEPSWFSSGVNTVTATMLSKNGVETEDTTYDSTKTYYYIDNDTLTAWTGGQDGWASRPTLYERDSATPITYKAMWAVWGSGVTPQTIVAFTSATQSATQYDTTPINFLVYDPSNETASCTLQVGTEDARSLTANRTMQTFNYAPQEYGSKTVTLTCGASSTTMTLNIAQSQYSIGMVTGDNLRYNLDPIGHNNSDADRSSFGNLTFSSGFDWVNGGFQTDTDGASAFVVKKGHRATLPRRLFEDADGNGKTIDISFKIKNSDLYSAVAMQELNNGASKGLILRANEGELRLNNTTGQLFRYCEDSRIDLSVNVEAVNDQRVMTVWLDGIPAQVNQYSANTLVQDENSLVIGSDNCDVWIYGIRIYNTSLSNRDMIQNYIFCGATTADKIERYQKNNIFDNNGVITPETLHDACPDLTIVHISADRMTTNKSDPVDATVTIRDGSNVLTLDNNTKFKVQGTSSAAYGRSAYNLDIDFKKSGETYTLSSGAIPVNYINIKVNVASSENANNICAADMYNTYQPYLVPARATAGVRDTVEGKPCAVFFTNTSVNTIWIGSQQLQPQDTVLYAMGDICNSKKNTDVFGQSGTGEHYCKGCIEVSGNDTAAQQFRATSTYNAAADDGKGEWQTTSGGTTSKDYEWRAVPKSDDKSDVISAWNDAVAWVVSTDPSAATEEALSPTVTYDGVEYDTDDAEYRTAKFKAEVSNYFAIDSLLYHFLYLEFYSAFDNVSKNTFYSYDWDSTENKYLWNICKNYDDDTILGCDNDGKPLADYGADFGDAIGNHSLFNADNNPIWVNIKAAFSTELANMYISLKSSGAWNASTIINKWDTYQNIRPHAAMVEDAYNKYILPYKTTGVVVAGETKSYDDSYLARLQGSKTYQRRQFVTYQTKYMDGKYGYYTKANSIAFRANAPTGTTQDFTISAYAKSYVTVIADDSPVASKKIETGSSAVFQNIAVHSNTTIYITPESLITSITPLYGIENTTFSAAGASKLQEVILGSAESENTSWDSNTGLSIPSVVLEEISIRNITNFAKPLDLSANVELESVDTRGTSAGIISLPSYAPLTSVYLNACSGIIAKNLNSVETFSVASGSNLITVQIEDCNSTVNDALISLLEDAVNDSSNVTRRIRVTGVNWSFQNGDLLYKIASKWKGYNNLGDEIDTPVIAGTCYISVLSTSKYNALHTAFPSLTITVGSTVSSYTVTFKNYDNSTLATEVVDQGSTLVDPREFDVNPISTPTRPSTAASTYTFDGWSWTDGGAVIADLSSATVNADATIYAHYTSATRTYTVNFWSGSNSLLPGNKLKTRTVPYGSEVTYLYDETEDTTYNSSKTYYYLNNGVYTAWTGGQDGWASRPTLYEKDDTLPVSADDGSSGEYYLFTGWDKSTGFVTENLEVYAQYEHDHIPAQPESGTTALSFKPTELKALIEGEILSPSGTNNTHIASGNTIDIVAGHDFAFTNVASHELIGLSSPQTFDGTNYLKPQVDSSDILLFNEDKSFTLVVDFAFNTSTDSGSCLASCYHGNGFLLRYSSGGSVRYGASSAQQASSNGVRQIVVIRKKAGDNKLYVYASNQNGNNISYSALTQSAVPSHTAPLSFGAQVASDGYVDNYAKGTVYWAKLWDGDLGDTACRELAAWSRQTFKMQAVGSSEHVFRNFTRVDNQRYVNCAFLLKDLLEETHAVNPSNSNAGGWKAMPMRTWLNKRLFNALPIQWQQLVQTVYVHSNTGQNATGLVDPPAEDKIWIPSYKEVQPNITSSPYSLESDAQFNIFTSDNATRIKKMNFGSGSAGNWWLRSPNTSYSNVFYGVNGSGSVNFNDANYAYGVAFGFCI